VRRWAGEGIFGCKLRPDGTVVSVKALKSTGYARLDQAAIAALRQSRFKVPSAHVVGVPIRFAMGAMRHRMSGAVIFD
jgi:TonB family protein